jgi:FAD binding domain
MGCWEGPVTILGAWPDTTRWTDGLGGMASEIPGCLPRYNQREGRTVLEVLLDFKSCAPPLAWLLEACPLLKPRQFSISSSAK